MVVKHRSAGNTLEALLNDWSTSSGSSLGMMSAISAPDASEQDASEDRADGSDCNEPQLEL